MLAADSPEAVSFDADERELVNMAQTILLTGWTAQEYEATPLAVIDAVMVVARAKDQIQANRTRRQQ